MEVRGDKSRPSARRSCQLCRPGSLTAVTSYKRSREVPPPTCHPPSSNFQKWIESQGRTGLGKAPSPVQPGDRSRAGRKGGRGSLEEREEGASPSLVPEPEPSSPPLGRDSLRSPGLWSHRLLPPAGSVPPLAHLPQPLCVADESVGPALRKSQLREAVRWAGGPSHLGRRDQMPSCWGRAACEGPAPGRPLGEQQLRGPLGLRAGNPTA